MPIVHIGFFLHRRYIFSIRYLTLAKSLKKECRLNHTFEYYKKYTILTFNYTKLTFAGKGSMHQAASVLSVKTILCQDTKKRGLKEVARIAKGDLNDI